MLLPATHTQIHVTIPRFVWLSISKQQCNVCHNFVLETLLLWPGDARMEDVQENLSLPRNKFKSPDKWPSYS